MYKLCASFFHTHTGLVQWDTLSPALDAIVRTNHTEIDKPDGEFPFSFKITFSEVPIRGNRYDRKRTAEDSSSSNNDALKSSGSADTLNSSGGFLQHVPSRGRGRGRGGGSRFDQ